MMVAYEIFVRPLAPMEAAAVAHRSAWASLNGESAVARRAMLEYAEAVQDIRDGAFPEELHANKAYAWAMVAFLAAKGEERTEYLDKARGQCVALKWHDCSDDSLLALAQEAASLVGK
jgi:hypothetical protein